MSEDKCVAGYEIRENLIKFAGSKKISNVSKKKTTASY